MPALTAVALIFLAMTQVPVARLANQNLLALTILQVDIKKEGS